MKEIKQNKKKWIGISLAVLIIVLGLSYALFTKTLYGQKQVSIVAEKLQLVLNDKETEGTTIPIAVPTLDKDGVKGKAYQFSLENNGNIDIEYQIYLDTDAEEMKKCVDCQELSEKDIRYELTSDSEKTIEFLDAGRMIEKGVIKKEKKNYTLRIWLNYDADNNAQNKVFYGKIRVEGSQVINNYEDGTPNEPVLADNMIPVVYNGYNWVKADVNTKWYDYERQIWANAVTVTDESRSKYQGTEAGTKIEMADILMMYVWIPRYSYTIKQPYGKQEIGRETLPTKELPGEIDVKFISVGDKDKGTAQYQGDLAKEWYTPPGFTFGNKELSGVWIGKFETGSVTGTSPGDVEPATSKNLVAIKPNTTSWRYIRISTLEEISMGITSEDNIYGFDQTTYDAHAMKNTEWALISYLIQSKYGKYGNSLYVGENKQVYINNYSGYLTGCSSGQGTAESSGSCAFRYDDLTSQGGGTGYAGAGASSTGNIYGIYDVSGGAWEYVMGNLANPDKRSGNAQEGNSGYTGKLADNTTFTGRDWKDDKYYDFYSSTSASTACVIDGSKNSPCKGHALNEVTGWYGDRSNMVYAAYPWFVRGGDHNYGAGTGIFAFSSAYGNAYYSFRQILTPQL